MTTLVSTSGTGLRVNAAVKFISANNRTLETIFQTIIRSSTHNGIMQAYATTLKGQHWSFDLAVKKVVSQKLQKGEDLEAKIKEVFKLTNLRVLSEHHHRNRTLTSSVSEFVLTELDKFLRSTSLPGIQRYRPRLIVSKNAKTVFAKLTGSVNVAFEVMTPSQARKSKTWSNTRPYTIDLRKDHTVRYLLNRRPELVVSMIDAVGGWIANLESQATKFSSAVFENTLRSIVKELEAAHNLANSLLSHFGLSSTRERRSSSVIDFDSARIMSEGLQSVTLEERDHTPPQPNTTKEEFVEGYLMQLERACRLIKEAEKFQDDLTDSQIMVWSKVKSFERSLCSFHDQLLSFLNGEKTETKSSQQHPLHKTHQNIIGKLRGTLEACGLQTSHNEKVRAVLVAGTAQKLQLAALAANEKLCLFVLPSNPNFFKASKKIKVVQLKDFKDLELTQLEEYSTDRPTCFLSDTEVPTKTWEPSLFAIDVRGKDYWSRQFQEEPTIITGVIGAHARWDGKLVSKDMFDSLDQLKTLYGRLPIKDPKWDGTCNEGEAVNMPFYLSYFQSVADRIDLMSHIFRNANQRTKLFLRDLRVMGREIKAYITKVEGKIKPAVSKKTSRRRSQPAQRRRR